MFYAEEQAILACEEDPSLIFELMKEGHFYLVDNLLKKKKVSVATLDNDGNNVLMKLAKLHQYELVFKYLSKDEDIINHQNNEGNTLLHILATRNYMKVAPIIKKLKRNDNLILSIDEKTEETLNPNLIQFLKYAISKKEFTFTISELVSKLNLFITPPVLGKLISSNKDELEKLGLFIECKRTQTERLYTAKYKEPLEILADNIFSESNSNNLNSKEE